MEPYYSIKAFVFPLPFVFPLLCVLSLSCSSKNGGSLPDSKSEPDNKEVSDSMSNGQGSLANVTNVSVSGAPSAYTFSVTLESGDSGCEHYANWWEVVDSDGTLLYRRILGHSHVNEQPFTRTGGVVEISANQEVYVRAHMNDGGYGGLLLKGAPETGFTTSMRDTLGNSLAKEAPLPNGCAF